MRSRIISITGLTLFAVAAVFWADYYTYQAAARSTGDKMTLTDYAVSIRNRLSGRPDALALRQARLAAEAQAMAEAAGRELYSIGASRFAKVGDEPGLARSKSRAHLARGFMDGPPDENQAGAMNSRFSAPGGGIRFISARK